MCNACDTWSQSAASSLVAEGSSLSAMFRKSGFWRIRRAFDGQGHPFPQMLWRIRTEKFAVPPGAGRGASEPTFSRKDTPVTASRCFCISMSSGHASRLGNHRAAAVRPLQTGAGLSAPRAASEAARKKRPGFPAGKGLVPEPEPFRGTVFRHGQTEFRPGQHGEHFRPHFLEGAAFECLGLYRLSGFL